MPIPALYHLPTDRAVLNQESLSHILGVLDAKGTRHWWDGPVADFVTLGADAAVCASIASL